jgi:hypothetical protein
MGRSCRRCWVCGGSSPVAGLHSFASLTDPGGIDQAGGRYMTPIRAHAKGFVPDSAPAAPVEADPQRRACGARARRPGPHMVRQKARSTAERAEHAEIQVLRFARSARTFRGVLCALCGEPTLRRPPQRPDRSQLIAAGYSPHEVITADRAA